MANRVDPDQMLHSAASDLGSLILDRPAFLNTEGIIITLSIGTDRPLQTV